MYKSYIKFRLGINFKGIYKIINAVVVVVV